MPTQKELLKIAVVFGGRSTEHEVSIVSAMQVIQFLTGRYDIIPIYITKDGRWFTGPQLLDIEAYKKLDTTLNKCQTILIVPDSNIKAIISPFGQGLLKPAQKVKIDVVFPVLHGFHGEDGTLQGLLELADIPYVGSGVLASSVGMNKIITKQILRDSGIPVLDHIAFTRHEWETDEQGILKRIEGKFPYPVIVKPACLGSSIGVEVAKDKEDLMLHISVASRLDFHIMVEPYLSDCIEVNCALLGNDEPIVSTTEQPIKSGGVLSFDDKYVHGEPTGGMANADRKIPAPVSDKLTRTVQCIATEAFKIIGCSGVVRIDFLVNEKQQKVFLNEINVIPGSIAYYLWNKPPHNISSQDLVDRLVRLALAIHDEKKRTKFTEDRMLLNKVNFLGLKKG